MLNSDDESVRKLARILVEMCAFFFAICERSIFFQGHYVADLEYRWSIYCFSSKFGTEYYVMAWMYNRANYTETESLIFLSSEFKIIKMYKKKLFLNLTLQPNALCSPAVMCFYLSWHLKYFHSNNLPSSYNKYHILHYTHVMRLL